MLGFTEAGSNADVGAGGTVGVDGVRVHPNDAIGDDRIVRTIVKIRDAIAERTKTYEVEVGAMKQQKEQLEAELLRRLLARGATSTKTEFGTAYKGEDWRVSISDEVQFFDFVKTQEDLDWFQKRVSVEHLREFMRDHGDRLPPGLSLFREAKINVRKS